MLAPTVTKRARRTMPGTAMTVDRRTIRETGMTAARRTMLAEDKDRQIALTTPTTTPTTTILTTAHVPMVATLAAVTPAAVTPVATTPAAHDRRSERHVLLFSTVA
jgi:hypothetical protein